MITTDEGGTWHASGYAAAWCAASRPSEAEIWVRCDAWTGQSAILVSRDAGRTWTLRTARIPFELTAVGGGEAWAVSYPHSEAAFRDGIPRRLWHTTDGGATWQQVWVSLSPNAPAVQVTTGRRAGRGRRT